MDIDPGKYCWMGEPTDIVAPYVESKEEREKRLGQERRNEAVKAHEAERGALEALRKKIKRDDGEKTWNVKYTRRGRHRIRSYSRRSHPGPQHGEWNRGAAVRKK